MLQQVLNEKKHLGKTLDVVMNGNKKLGARDRHFIAENVFGIIRFLRYYHYLTNQQPNTNNVQLL